MGSATARPDLAVIGAGVETFAKTPQAALDAQNKATDVLLTAVRRHGVAERDIRTESLSLSPVTEYQNGVSHLAGYQAAQSFSVKVRDLAATGRILQAITDATGAAGRINSVAFDVTEPAPSHRDARAAAHEDAHSKALQYAHLSGHRLGRLVSLTDDTADVSRPVPVAADLPAGVASGVPVAPGGIRATVTVTAVYELN
ncbi:SIMPL domain-containing protein [Streptomyces sp. Agncl-13]|uniref:SIMPL domain-containing protein n=1 Tax=Streptomyces sp. Agncl-13 TaxID=3400628 RepID=UPI003A862761